MTTKLSLKNRIVIAFTIQTLLVALIAFSTIGFYVDYIEETVLYEHLSQYLDAYVSELDEDRVPAVPKDIKIYTGDKEDVPIFAKNLGTGGHEIMLENGTAFHVLNKYYDNRLFSLIKDQTEFEKIEDNINLLTLMVLLLFSVVSFVFSRSLADRIIQPVVSLSEKVSGLNVDNFNDIKLEYPNDEIGTLVKLIYDQIYTLNLYLQREKWFTGDISHELRTPMMVISSSVDLLKQSTIKPEQRTQIYQRIDNALRSVNELINTFLMLARGKAEDQGEPVLCNLSELAHEVIDKLENYMGNKNINIRIVSDSTVMLPVNSVLFSIVLSNLVKNAIFNTDEGEIVVILKQDGFQVKDTGKGLPGLVKQFINGSDFYVPLRNNNHFGLGLAIVKRVCERERWSITAYDGDKGGACFLVGF